MQNETIYNYINSKDIRNHLKTIGYQFTSLEAAWLIYQCESLTLAQKHEAWNDLIATMPDMPIDMRAFRHHEEKSLHNYLKRYMDIDRRWLEEFKQPDNSVYRFSTRGVVYNDPFQYADSCCVFSSYENCLNAAKSDVAEYNETEIKNFRFKITKKKIDDSEEMTNYTEVFLDHNFEIISVDYFSQKHPDEDEWIHYDFEEMWFSFPTPFKKGDIIYNITTSPDWFCNGPMVLEKIAPDIFAEKGRPGSDSGDMVVVGYFQNADTGSIYYEDSGNYMDYEYYPKEKLTGNRRVLLAISNLLKGQIDIGLCIRAYHQILLEESAKDLMPNGYTQEGLQLAGLQKESNCNEKDF